MSDQPLISVVLPCRNQADHIGRIVPEYAGALERAGMRFELVVVPNASRDETETRVRELAAADPRVRCVANPRGGWGLSVRVGLAAARGEILSYTNTARTEPGSVPDFVRRQLEHPGSLVKAARRRRNAPLREVGSWLYNLEARLLFGARCDDVNGTPKVFERRLYDRMALAQDGDLLDLELIAQATRLGVPVVDLPTFGFHRHGGKSSTTFRSAWRMYGGALGLRLRLPRPGPGVGGTVPESSAPTGRPTAA
jgi:glycosyltransferase involved in cell wall biosynthesis